MNIGARCGSCNRELLLVQLVQPSDGFRCPFCGLAFAPAYATVAPAVGARVMVAQAALVTALAELGSMTGDRLRLDRATIIDPRCCHLTLETRTGATAPESREHRTRRCRGPSCRPPGGRE
jgi:hypothetical protein